MLEMGLDLLLQIAGVNRSRYLHNPLHIICKLLRGCEGTSYSLLNNLQKLQAEFKRNTSSLKYQTMCVATFPDQQDFLVGSIEGRVGVHYLDEQQQSTNFTFKCHRQGNDIYPFNSLTFHPVHHTFATPGSDGAFNFWDKRSKQR